MLQGSDVKRCSIAMRMTWASDRETTRPEDSAYCLLGIFGVNMPLLYGEGAKAFLRLQVWLDPSRTNHVVRLLNIARKRL